MKHFWWWCKKKIQNEVAKNAFTCKMKKRPHGLIKKPNNNMNKLLKKRQSHAVEELNKNWDIHIAKHKGDPYWGIYPHHSQLLLNKLGKHNLQSKDNNLSSICEQNTRFKNSFSPLFLSTEWYGLLDCSIVTCKCDHVVSFHRQQTLMSAAPSHWLVDW